VKGCTGCLGEALPRPDPDIPEHPDRLRRIDSLIKEAACSKTGRLPSAGTEESSNACTMKHIIALLLENEPGALSRVVGLFSARGYNIESLTVAPTEDASLSRMTVVTTGSDEVIEQITKHLNRLIEVVKVVDLTEGAYTERELMLIKVRAVGKEREEMKRMAEIFRARIIDVTEKSYTIELTGDQGKLDAFIGAVDRAVILETVRTGTSGIGRGERILRV
jgi:acetolactate synthase-1/3 small subunit